MTTTDELPVRLEDPAALPTRLAAQVAQHDDLFLTTAYTDNLLRESPLSAFADVLANYLRGRQIVGYHCTREPAPGYFAAHGLRLTSIAQHQAEFLERHGHRFTSEEVAYMRRKWADYFKGLQLEVREGRIWACLTPALALSDGPFFFEAFGGEAIYKPLDRESSAAKKLAEIGRPVVVEVVLPGDRLNHACDLARGVLNYHHRRVNPDAHRLEPEGYVREAVPPSNVLRVVPYAQFASEVGLRAGL